MVGKIDYSADDIMWEYKVVSLDDNDNGKVDIQTLSEGINRLAAKGWRLKAAFSNTFEKSASAKMFLGMTSENSVVKEQNIIIFERRKK